MDNHNPPSERESHRARKRSRDVVEHNWKKRKTRVLSRNNKKDAKLSSPKVVPHDVLSNTIQCDLSTQLQYAREGHAVLRGFLPPTLLQSLRINLMDYSAKQSLDAWQQKVLVANGGNLQESTSCTTIERCQHLLQNKYHIPVGNLPFLQFFNTWQTLPSVEELVKSPLLSSTASQLMGIRNVRLYQDSLFVKRFGDGPTPWHIDAKMAPFDTSHMITFWIPLQRIRSNGTGLHFVSKSHSDMALPYWNPISDDGPEHARLEHRYGVLEAFEEEGDTETRSPLQHYMPMNLGDVTVHSGWTLHCSDSNDGPTSTSMSRKLKNPTKHSNTSNDRYALAISYADARAEVREDVILAVNRMIKNKSKHDDNTSTREHQPGTEYLGDDEDMIGYMNWIVDVKPRTQFHHTLVPQVWPRSSKNNR